MKMQSIDDLLYTGLTYTHDFEQQVSNEAQKMAAATSDPELKEMFEKSHTKGQEYAERIQNTFKKLGKEAKSNSNPIAKAMIEEVENMIANTDASPVRDAALIVAANQQQAYRVSAYGSLKEYAGMIGKEDAVAELANNLEESKNGDKKLNTIAESNVNKKAAEASHATA